MKLITKTGLLNFAFLIIIVFLFSVLIRADNSLLIKSSEKQWTVTKSTGVESQLTFWTLNAKDKKTELGWIPPDNSCSGWVDKYIYNETNGYVLDDKNKPILLKCESAKCSGKNCYHISLTNAQAININEFIKLGQGTITVEYQDIKRVNYQDTWFDLNATLFINLNGDWNNTINSIFVYDNPLKKFGANATGFNTTKQFKYVVESSLPILHENDYKYYIGRTLPKKFGSIDGAIEERHWIDFSDICSPKINETIIDEEGSIDGKLLFNPDCQFIGMNSQEMQVTFYAEYNSTLDLISIDPTINVGQVNQTAGVQNNVTCEEYPYCQITLNDSSLTFYMPFDVTHTANTNITYDYSSGNRDAQIVNKGGIVWNSSSRYKGAYEFNGDGSSINITGATNFSINDNAFSISAWTKYYHGPNSTTIMIRKGTVYPFTIDMNNVNRVRIGVRNATGALYSPLATGAALTIGAWSHIVMTYNGSTGIIYLNNLQVDNVTVTGELSFGTGANTYTVIGASQTSDNRYNGTVDELMIFNKAISAAEVSNIYNNQSYRYKTPASQLFQNISISQDGTYNRVNVTTNSSLPSGINISLRLQEYGVGNVPLENTSWQNILEGNNNVTTFTVLTTAYNVTLEFNYTSDPYNFYSPILKDSIVVDSWVQAGVAGNSYTSNFSQSFTATSSQGSKNSYTRKSAQSISTVGITGKLGFFWKTIAQQISTSSSTKRISLFFISVKQYFSISSVTKRTSLFFAIIIQPISLTSIVSKLGIFFKSIAQPLNLFTSIPSYETPSIDLTLITPNDLDNINVTQYQFFNITLNVTCRNANCGEINISFDPTTSNIALKMNYTKSLEPSASYPDSGNNFSTDGYLAKGYTALSYGYNLTAIGNRVILNLTLNLTKNYILDRVAFWGVAHAIFQYEYLPDNISIYTSSDGNSFQYLAINTSFENQKWTNTSLNSVEAQYVLIIVDKKCVSTYTDWMFIDEIQVWGTETKGLISTTTGEIPFYTNESNPRNITLNKDESQLVTAWVNATGIVLYNYTFFVYANQTSNMAISNLTGKWNVTIIGQTINISLINFSQSLNAKSGINKFIVAVKKPAQPLTITLIQSKISKLLINVWGYLNIKYTTNKASGLLMNLKNSISLTSSTNKIEGFKIDIVESFSITSITGRTSSFIVSIKQSFSITSITNRLAKLSRNIYQLFTLNPILSISLVSSDNEYPTFSNYWDNNGTLNSTGIAFFNVSILGSNGSAFLQINGTNFTATNWTATLFNISITMVNNTYEYQWISWGNGTLHNLNVSSTRYYSVNSSTITNYQTNISQALSLTSIGNRLVTYLRNPVQSITITTIIKRSGNLFIKIRNSFSLTAITSKIYSGLRNIAESLKIFAFPVKLVSYIRNLFIPIEIHAIMSGANESIQDTLKPNVTSLAVNPASPVEWVFTKKYTFNATIVDDRGVGTVILIFNNVNYTATNASTSIYNVTISNMQANPNKYNYTWWANDTSGNVNNSESGTYNITKREPTGATLTRTPAVTLTYPVETTMTGNDTQDGSEDLVWTLYNNKTGVLAEVSNPDVNTFGVGTYLYWFNTSGATNYTRWLVTSTITINQNTTGNMTLWLNNSMGNLTIKNGTSIWINASLNSINQTTKLFVNGTLINEGVTPLQNLTSFNTIFGLYNITAVFTGNTNYTGSYRTWYVNVTPGDLSLVNISQGLIPSTIINRFTHAWRNQFELLSINAITSRTSQMFRNVFGQITSLVDIDRTAIISKRFSQSITLNSIARRTATLLIKSSDGLTIGSSTTRARESFRQAVNFLTIKSFVSKSQNIYRHFNVVIDLFVKLAGLIELIFEQLKSAVLNIYPNTNDVPYVKLNETNAFN